MEMSRAARWYHHRHVLPSAGPLFGPKSRDPSAYSNKPTKVIPPPTANCQLIPPTAAAAVYWNTANWYRLLPPPLLTESTNRKRSLDSIRRSAPYCTREYRSPLRQEDGAC